MRRRPSQARSQDKCRRIVAATAQLIDSAPFDAVTMSAISRASGASFSSIYRFFPSKEAIYEAIVVTGFDSMEEQYKSYFRGAVPKDGAQIIDNAIDIYVGFILTEPGFRTLWLGWAPSHDIARRVHGLNRPALELAKLYAVRQLGFQATPDLDLRLAIATTAATEILRFAFRDHGFPRERVIAELKHWLKAALLMF